MGVLGGAGALTNLSTLQVHGLSLWSKRISEVWEIKITLYII